MSSLHLTAVICTHNRSGLLEKAIDSINRATRPDDCLIDILVIPNNCTDDTVRLLESYPSSFDKSDGQKPLPLAYSEENNSGKSHALNHAIDIINMGYMCFIDDDHRIDESYFLSVRNTIREHADVGMFCGRIIPDWKGDEPAWVHDEGKYRIYPLPIPDFNLGEQPHRVAIDSRLPGGGNLVVLRDIFSRIGGFSASLGPKGKSLLGSEDSEFLLRALSQNESLFYSPDIVQFHYVDTERLKLNYLVRKSFQRSRSITLAHNPQKSPIPRYLWRKLVNYLAGFIFSLSYNKRRFYLMRSAAALGEIAGLRGNTD
jgi:glycosyltransferase involved in cell wall biosynthesis